MSDEHLGTIDTGEQFELNKKTEAIKKRQNELAAKNQALKTHHKVIIAIAIIIIVLALLSSLDILKI